MSIAQRPPRVLHLAAALTLASASPIRPGWLFERADTCSAGASKCPQAGPPGLLAGDTTVLCCPNGSNCAAIEPISCNITLQDPSKFPSSEVKTTELNLNLPTCGHGCCPFGFHCDKESGFCIEDDDQSLRSGEAMSLPTSSTRPTATGSSKPTSIAVTASATNLASSSEITAAKTMNTATVVGGVIGGLFALALMAGGIFFCRRSSKKADDEKPQSGTSSIVGPIIGNPIKHNRYPAERAVFPTTGQSSSYPSTPTQIQDRFSPRSPAWQSSPYGYYMSAEPPPLSSSRNLTNRYSNGMDRYSYRSEFQDVDAYRPRGGSGRSGSIIISTDKTTLNTWIDTDGKRQTAWPTRDRMLRLCDLDQRSTQVKQVK
ncbi:hypothetical protein F4825DRAFT_459190 [Nemania diffusa]|nr:hypothetical protein F4825DRAFT_459190 [Nemania diffusa]